MSEHIPQRIDHYRYTDKGVFLAGVIKQQELETNLPRLCEAIVKTSADVEYQLQFDIDMSSNRIVSGMVKTSVILQCQRCMKDYEESLTCKILTAFVENDFEAGKAEQGNYDTFFINREFVDRKVAKNKKGLERKGLVDPRILIEDELLLMLPQIPRHSETGSGTSCHIQFDFPIDERSEQKSDSSRQEKDDNAFSVLKQLKDN
ncbi:MAG: DUF177 domain-containing protein [gamma proteobacterium symbiont of Taylorina sp.]|nr:DUF177 domain-containing protein [gamma proteobacterium symbiont of Taylorina sp.]